MIRMSDLLPIEQSEQTGNIREWPGRGPYILYLVVLSSLSSHILDARENEAPHEPPRYAAFTSRDTQARLIDEDVGAIQQQPIAIVRPYLLWLNVWSVTFVPNTSSDAACFAFIQ